jgi:hypothetical protein
MNLLAVLLICLTVIAVVYLLSRPSSNVVYGRWPGHRKHHHHHHPRRS